MRYLHLLCALLILKICATTRVLPNIARGKVTTQSSTGYGGKSDRAVDGNTNWRYNSGSCTHTSAMSNPNWEVHLNGLFRIITVEVFNRRDCCSERLNNFKVLVKTGRHTVVGVCGVGPVMKHKTFYRMTCNKPLIGSIVEVMLPGNHRILTLCEVKVRGEPAPILENIARGKFTDQSSIGYGGNPDRAVDGNTNSYWKAGSCTHTGGSTSNPSWEVYLNGLYTIESVTVFNRRDCCSERLNNFKVLVKTGKYKVVGVCGVGPVMKHRSHYTMACNKPLTGSIVEVTLPGYHRTLTLCEVKVYGVRRGIAPPFPVNIARAKTTSQSTQYKDADSDRAVDGNPDSNYYHRSCTHTKPSLSNPSWQVNLGARYRIESVTVHNRMDCCSERLSHFVISVRNSARKLVGTCGVGPDMKKRAFYSMVCESFIIGSIVEITLPGTSRILTLCEVEIFGKLQGPSPTAVNLALGKRTSQSSTSSNRVSSRAVDGNTNSNFYKHSCTHTKNSGEPNPNWQVDLGRAYIISSVVVYNRLDCCSQRLNHFKVIIKNRYNKNVGTCGSGPIMTKRAKYTLTCRTPILGSIVEIILPGSKRILTLCEVEVYGEEELQMSPIAIQQPAR